MPAAAKQIPEVIPVQVLRRKFLCQSPRTARRGIPPMQSARFSTTPFAPKLSRRCCCPLFVGKTTRLDPTQRGHLHERLRPVGRPSARPLQPVRHRNDPTRLSNPHRSLDNHQRQRHRPKLTPRQRLRRRAVSHQLSAFHFPLSAFPSHPWPRPDPNCRRSSVLRDDGVDPTSPFRSADHKPRPDPRRTKRTRRWKRATASRGGMDRLVRWQPLDRC